MAIYACAPETRVFAAAFCFAAAGLNAAGLTVCIAKGRRLLALARSGLAAALLAAFAAMSIPQLYLWEGAVLPIPALFLPSSLLAAAALGAVSCLPGRESAHWPLFGARLGLALCALSALRFSCVALPAFAVCAAAEATAFLLWLKRAARTPLPHLMARLARGLPVGVACMALPGHRWTRTRRTR